MDSDSYTIPDLSGNGRHLYSDPDHDADTADADSIFRYGGRTIAYYRLDLNARRISNADAAYSCSQRNPECNAGDACSLHKYCGAWRPVRGGRGAARR